MNETEKLIAEKLLKAILDAPPTTESSPRNFQGEAVNTYETFITAVAARVLAEI